MDHQTFPFDCKAVDDEEGTFEGYASVFGNTDAQRDVILPGAFRKTLKESGNRVRILSQHDVGGLPIGKPLSMTEDERGLWVKGRISQTSTGRDVLTLMRDGVISELSIGYRAIKDSIDAPTGRRLLHELKLYEFSPVWMASNDQAVITAVKEDPTIALETQEPPTGTPADQAADTKDDPLSEQSLLLALHTLSAAIKTFSEVINV